MGDIAFFDVTPLNGSGFIADWIKVCDDILQGSGGRDHRSRAMARWAARRSLDDMRNYLTLLMSEGRKQYDAGVSAGRRGSGARSRALRDVDGPGSRRQQHGAALHGVRGTIGTNMDRNATTPGRDGIQPAQA